MSLANNHLLRLIVAAPMLTCGARGLEARQVQRMQWYVYLITTSAAVVFSWSSLVLFGRPVRVLFHLRREILQQLLALENISAPRPRETAVSSREIREYGEAMRKLREAQRIFCDLGSQLLAFRESEPTICTAIRLFGLDIVAAGSGLNDLAEAYSRPGSERAGLRHEVVNALRATTPTYYHRHSQSNQLLDYQHRFLHLRDIGFTG